MTQQHPKATLGYILKGYPRISETFISNEVLLLEKLGFTMRLFPMRQPRESFSHASVKEIKARVDYLPTDLFGDFFRLLRPTLFLAIKKPQNFKQTLASAAAGSSTGRALATLKHLLQAGYLTNTHLVRDQSIAHLHGHFAHSPTSVTLFAALLSGLPFSFTAHAKDIYTTEPAKLRKKMAQAQFVVTCTRHNADYLRAIAGDCPTPIYCIYHGIDLELFHHPGAKETPRQPYMLLTVARLTEKKGLPTLYRALAGLRQKGIDFRHTLIGDGDDRQKIIDLIASLGLSEQCQLLGTQTHDQVLRHFQASDLFVLSCEIAENGDRDGIPNVLVESLAMGVPALSTTVSAIPEILIDGQTGMTVQPSQPKELAEAMLRLLSDQPLRQKIIAGGQHLVRENFDNRRMIQELAALFRRHSQALG